MPTTCLADTLLQANDAQWQRITDRDILTLDAVFYGIYDSLIPATSLNTFFNVYRAFEKPSYRDSQIIKTQLIYIAVGSTDTVDTILQDGIEFEKLSNQDLPEVALALLSTITSVSDLPTLMDYARVFQKYADLQILQLSNAILADFTIQSDPDALLLAGKQFQECSERELIVVQDQLLCELAGGVVPPSGSGILTQTGDNLVTEGGNRIITQ